MAPAEHHLLDSLASQASAIAADIAELEQDEADISLRLAKARALRSELLWKADMLNRQRLD